MMLKLIDFSEVFREDTVLSCACLQPQVVCRCGTWDEAHVAHEADPNYNVMRLHFLYLNIEAPLKIVL